MPKHFDRPMQRPTREIYMLDDQYYFYDEDCFGRSIQEFKLPITIRQIVDEKDKKRSSACLSIYSILIHMPKYKTHGMGSYEMKHVFERYIEHERKEAQYFTNDEGKLLMMSAGFHMTNRGQVNWRWNTSLSEVNYMFFDIQKRSDRRPIAVNVRPRYR